MLLCYCPIHGGSGSGSGSGLSDGLVLHVCTDYAIRIFIANNTVDSVEKSILAECNTHGVRIL